MEPGVLVSTIHCGSNPPEFDPNPRLRPHPLGNCPIEELSPETVNLATPVKPADIIEEDDWMVRVVKLGLDPSFHGFNALRNRSELTIPAVDNATKVVLESYGVLFSGVPAPGKHLIVLPKGWKKDRYSVRNGLGQSEYVILDPQKRPRVKVYEPISTNQCTFFDNEPEPVSSVQILLRFSIIIDEDKLKDYQAVANFMDGDEVVFSTNPIEISSESYVYKIGKQIDAMKCCSNLADEYLLGWQVPGMYWDQSIDELKLEFSKKLKKKPKKA